MLNHIVLMGRLVRDPELRRTGNGTACTNFTLAVDRDFSSKESGEKETDFIDCVAWRQTAEFVSKYFTKGKMAVASGRLQIRSWKDKDGNNRRTAEVIADNVYFAESKRSSEDNVSTNSTLAYGNDPFAQTKALIDKYGNAGAGYEIIGEEDDQLPF